MLKRLRRRLGLYERPPEPAFEQIVAGAELPPAIEARLGSLYSGEPQRGSDGAPHALDPITRVLAPQGRFLYELYRREKPALSLEIGLAYGFSTLFFLAGLVRNGGGRHLAIDPFQREQWHGIGLTHVAELGLGDVFRWIEETSARALPRLHAEGVRAQLVFVDGDHTFDSILVDFTLAAPLCEPGGLVVLDDLWLPSTRHVVAFVEANRPDFAREACPQRNLALFRKLAERDERSWDHYVPFAAPEPKRRRLARAGPAFARLRLAARRPTLESAS